MSEIIWDNKVVKKADIIVGDFNPRKISGDMLALLKKSLAENGEIIPIAVNADMTLISGHQRFSILNWDGDGDIEVRYPSRQLTAEEVKKAIIIANEKIGKWDNGKLTDLFSLEDLQSAYGFTERELQEMMSASGDDMLDMEFEEMDEQASIKKMTLNYASKDEVEEIEAIAKKMGESTVESALLKIIEQ